MNVDYWCWRCWRGWAVCQWPHCNNGSGSGQSKAQHHHHQRADEKDVRSLPAADTEYARDTGRVSASAAWPSSEFTVCIHIYTCRKTSFTICCHSKEYYTSYFNYCEQTCTCTCNDVIMASWTNSVQCTLKYLRSTINYGALLFNVWLVISNRKMQWLEILNWLL